MGRIFLARERRFGGYLDDYEAGDIYRHWPGKTVTEAEDHMFCMLTLAASPLHIDRHWAETESEYGRNVVVGTFVYSLLHGQPLLPPIALTDEVTALVGAFATLAALRHAEKTGEGQVADVNLLESMFQLMGLLVSAFAHLDYIQPRLGSGIPYTVPWGTYRCADGKWVAVSATADSGAARLLALVGLSGDTRFADFQQRSANRDAVETLDRAWIGARSFDEVMREFQRVNAAIAPVLDMRDIFQDPHFRAREIIAEVDGIAMQNVAARLSKTPGAIRHAGRSFDADTNAVLQELNIERDRASRQAD